jgi:hypothetical protein
MPSRFGQAGVRSTVKPGSLVSRKVTPATPNVFPTIKPAMMPRVIPADLLSSGG